MGLAILSVNYFLSWKARILSFEDIGKLNYYFLKDSFYLLSYRMNQANRMNQAKRNLKNREYRARKKTCGNFWNMINRLPDDMVREIVSFSPLPDSIVRDAELDFLLQKRREIFEALKKADTATIYRICKFGLFSKWALTNVCVKYSGPYKKYPSFRYDPSEFWTDNLDLYYSIGRNYYRDIRPEFIEIILQLISSKESDTGILRKRMLALCADLRIL